MTLKNGEKSEEELACRFKISRRNLTNFDPITGKSKTFAFLWAPSESLFIRCKEISKKAVKIEGFFQCSIHIFLGRNACL